MRWELMSSIGIPGPTHPRTPAKGRTAAQAPDGDFGRRGRGEYRVWYEWRAQDERAGREKDAQVSLATNPFVCVELPRLARDQGWSS